MKVGFAVGWYTTFSTPSTATEEEMYQVHVVVTYVSLVEVLVNGIKMVLSDQGHF